MAIFQDYAGYYNEFNKDKDYKSEADVVDALLNKYGSQIKRIINFGCGTGKHDIEHARLGYKCTGIDASTGMIDQARKNAENCNYEIDFQIANITAYETESKYDAVISLFHVISYQAKNEQVLSTFKTARSLIEKGGIFIFDVWYGPGVLTDKPSVRVKEVDNSENKLIRIAKPSMCDKENLVNVSYDILVIDKDTNKINTISELHTMRYFFRPELEMFLSMAGFELIDNIDCTSLKDTDYNSWTSYFIARAV